MAHHTLTALPLVAGHEEIKEEFRKTIAVLGGSAIWVTLAEWTERYPGDAELHGALAKIAMQRTQEWAGVGPDLRVVE